MKVVGGSASVGLAQNLAKILGVDYVPVLLEKHPGGFPDGEQYVRLQIPVQDEDVILVQTTYPDSKIIELMLLEDAIHEAGASSLTMIVPYFGYGRQDKKFEDGECISARALAKHIQYQVDKIFTMGLHKPDIVKFFDVPIKEVDGMPAIAGYLHGKGVDIVLGPDHGAIRHAQSVSKVLDVPWDYMEKERIDSFTVKMSLKKLDVEGNTVALVDDLISTGRTIANAATAVKQQGAKNVITACVHGLFNSKALEILKMCDEVVSTDTVISPVSKISVAEQFADALREN